MCRLIYNNKKRINITNFRLLCFTLLIILMINKVFIFSAYLLLRMPNKCMNLFWSKVTPVFLLWGNWQVTRSRVGLQAKDSKHFFQSLEM